MAAGRGAGTEPTPHICKCHDCSVQERVLGYTGAEDAVRAVKEKGKLSELFLYTADSFPRCTPCVSQASLCKGRKGSTALESETLRRAEQMKGLPSVNKLF